jgi:hypothetical protein
MRSALSTTFAVATAFVGTAIVITLILSLVHPWFTQETPVMAIQYWPLSVAVCVRYEDAKVCTDRISWASASARDGTGLDAKIHAAVEEILLNAQICDEPVSIVDCITRHAANLYGYSPLTGYELHHTIGRAAALMGVMFIYPVVIFGVILTLLYLAMEYFRPALVALPGQLMLIGIGGLVLGMLISTVLVFFEWNLSAVLAERGSIEGAVGTVSTVVLLMSVFLILSRNKYPA